MTSTGTQPNLFDQLGGIWTRYCVYGTKVTVEAMTPTASSPTMLTVRPTLSSSAPTDVEAEAERRWGKSTIIGANTSKGKIVEYVDVGSLYGFSKEQVLTDDLFAANVSANPGNVVYLNVVCKPLDNTTTTTVYLTVTLLFYTKWTNVLDQNPS